MLGHHGLAVGDRDLVVVGVDFVEGQKTVAIAAIVDECRLQGRLYPDDLREIDVSLELLAGRDLEVIFLQMVFVQNHHPGFLPVGGIDQHALSGHEIRLSKYPAAPAAEVAADGGTLCVGGRRRLRTQVSLPDSERLPGVSFALL